MRTKKKSVPKVTSGKVFKYCRAINSFSKWGYYCSCRDKFFTLIRSTYSVLITGHSRVSGSPLPNARDSRDSWETWDVWTLPLPGHHRHNFSCGLPGWRHLAHQSSTETLKEMGGKLSTKQWLHPVRCGHCLLMQAAAGARSPENNRQHCGIIEKNLSTGWTREI